MIIIFIEIHIKYGFQKGSLSLVRRTYAQAVIVQEKIPCLGQKLIKSIPWLRQKMIKSIPCLRQKSRKTYPGWPHVPMKPIEGSTPSPRGTDTPLIWTLSIDPLLSILHYCPHQTKPFDISELQEHLSLVDLNALGVLISINSMYKAGTS